MRRLTALAFLAATPALAEPPWWQGIWAFDPAWCINWDRVGQATPAPIAITASAVIGYENACAIRSATEIGDAAVHLHLACEGEGQKFEEDHVLMRQDADRIWQWVGFAEPEAFTRCREAKR